MLKKTLSKMYIVYQELLFLPVNLFSWSLNISFLLIFFFLGNLLRNTCAKVSIQFLIMVGFPPPPPFFFFFFFFLSLFFLFSNGNTVDLEVNILSY